MHSTSTAVLCWLWEENPGIVEELNLVWIPFMKENHPSWGAQIMTMVIYSNSTHTHTHTHTHTPFVLIKLLPSIVEKILIWYWHKCCANSE